MKISALFEVPHSVSLPPLRVRITLKRVKKNHYQFEQVLLLWIFPVAHGHLTIWMRPEGATKGMSSLMWACARDGRAPERQQQAKLKQ